MGPGTHWLLVDAVAVCSSSRGYNVGHSLGYNLVWQQPGLQPGWATTWSGNNLGYNLGYTDYIAIPSCMAAINIAIGTLQNGVQSLRGLVSLMG